VDTGSFLTAGPHGLAIFSDDTTSQWTIKKSDGTNLSTTNYGIVMAHAATATAGQLTARTITANVTMTLSGLEFGNNSLGDLTNGILDIVYLNSSVGGAWGTSFYPGGARPMISTSDINKTQASCTSYDDVFADTNTGEDAKVTPCFWIRTTFDDTGGIAENIWSIKTGVADLNVGSSDGLWRQWNPTHTGFTASIPTFRAVWTSIRNQCFINYITINPGNTSGTSYVISAPMKSGPNGIGSQFGGRYNNGGQFGIVMIQQPADGFVVNLFPTTAGTAWTTTGDKGADVSYNFEIGNAVFQ